MLAMSGHSRERGCYSEMGELAAAIALSRGVTCLTQFESPLQVAAPRSLDGGAEAEAVHCTALLQRGLPLGAGGSSGVASGAVLSRSVVYDSLRPHGL